MICDICSFENPDGNNYCGKCGGALSNPSVERIARWSNIGIVLLGIGAVAILLVSILYALLAYAYGTSADFLFDGSRWIYDLSDVMFNWHVFELGLVSSVIGLVLVFRAHGISKPVSAKVRAAMSGSAIITLVGLLTALIFGNGAITPFLFTMNNSFIAFIYISYFIVYVGVGVFIAVLTYMVWSQRGRNPYTTV